KEGLPGSPAAEDGMSLLDIFRRSKPPTVAAQAKERLQIVLAHERSGRDSPDFLPALQQELLAVIKKYVSIDDDKVAVKLERDSGCAMLEVNLDLRGPAKRGAKAGTTDTVNCHGAPFRLKGGLPVTPTAGHVSNWLPGWIWVRGFGGMRGHPV